MASLAPESAPSVEKTLVAWLSALGRAATERGAGEALPFRIVKRVAGADDPIIGIDTATVSVHTLAATSSAAHEAAQITHRRMVLLARNPQTAIALLDGGVTNVDYCKTLMSPVEVDYGETDIKRYVARYEIGVSYTPVAP
ncbi:hypothetical protein ABQE69_09035 [Mycolicibacillus trivialis]